MSALPWSKFFWAAWETDPALRVCSMAAQGFWMRLLCICAKSDGDLLIGGKRAAPAQLAQVTGQAVSDVEAWLAELGEAGVFSRTRGGVIYSRRMREDREKRERSREFGKRGGNPALKKQGVMAGGVNPPVKLEEEEEEEEEPPKPPKGEAPRKRAAGKAPLSEAELAAFEAFWAVYPLKKGKKPARDRFIEVIRSKRADHATLMRAAGCYAAEREGQDASKTKYAQGWLSDERWNDYPLAAAPSAPADDRPPVDEHALWRDRLIEFRKDVWWPDSYGSPKPFHAGCKAPSDLVAEILGPPPAGATVVPFPQTGGVR